MRFSRLLRTDGRDVDAQRSARPLPNRDQRCLRRQLSHIARLRRRILQPHRYELLHLGRHERGKSKESFKIYGFIRLDRYYLD